MSCSCEQIDASQLRLGDEIHFDTDDHTERRWQWRVIGLHAAWRGRDGGVTLLQNCLHINEISYTVNQQPYLLVRPR